MRAFNFVAWTGILILVAITTVKSVHAETKQICHDRVDKKGNPVLDKKTGKTAQDCKTIKIHQKFEGTVVPEKPSKK
jgi:hypothetical protein